MTLKLIILWIFFALAIINTFYQLMIHIKLSDLRRPKPDYKHLVYGIFSILIALGTYIAATTLTHN